MVDLQAMSGLGLPLLIDAMIVLTLVEFAVLAGWHRSTGKGPALHMFGWNMLSGLCMMVALRCMVRDTGPAWILACLLAAGLAHAVAILRFQR